MTDRDAPDPPSTPSATPGIRVTTDQGVWTQHYLPGCTPDAALTEALPDRPDIHRFALLVRGMLRHHYAQISLAEAQAIMALIFREMGRG